MKVLNTKEDKKSKVTSGICKKHTLKDNTNLKKKMLKVLKSKEVYSSDGETEEENLLENCNKFNVYFSNGRSKDGKTHESSSKKKKVVKSKETLQEENEMVQIISNIICKKRKILPNKMSNVVSTNNSKTKKDKHYNDEKNERKNMLNILDQGKVGQKKIKQNINYKHSVMEIFDSGKLKGAIVKSTDLHLNVNNSKLDNNSKRVLQNYQHILDNLDNMNSEVESDYDICDAPEVDGENYNHDKGTDEGLKNLEMRKNCFITQTLKPKPYKIYTFSNCCVLIMNSDVTLYFCGVLKATLIWGAVDILGHEMDSLPQEVYSPPTSSLLYFKSHQHSYKTLDLSKLSNYNLSNTDCKLVSENTGINDSVLILQPLSNKVIEFITKYFTEFNVFVKKLNVVENTEAFELLKCHFSAQDRQGIVKMNLAPAVSNEILTRMETKTIKNITMICGGKGAGKSTLLRYLANMSVAKNSILVLDFDPGQPEFTVCGLLSATVVSQPLLGPNFTHLITPDRSIALGFINILENEDRYIACIQDLFKYCLVHGKYTEMPWFINTSGLTGPIGLKLLTFILNIVQPTLVIELMCKAKKLDFEIRLNPSNINKYQQDVEFRIDDTVIEKVSHDYNYNCLNANYELHGRASFCRNIEPKDLRLLNVLAYFSQLPNYTFSILEELPYEISMKNIKLAFNNLYADRKYIYSIINAKIVALCRDNNINNENKHIINIDLLSCYGFGIVRGIDYEKQKIYITTPVKPNIITFINTLVYSECLPDCNVMSIESLPQGTIIPYAMPYVHDDLNNHLMKSPKRNFNPFRLLEIRNKT